MCVHTINKLTINKDDNVYIHTAPVLKVAQLYRKLIASLIGIAAEGIIILPKMNLIVVIAVKSGLTYYAVSTNNSILNRTDQNPNSKPIVFLQSCQLPGLHLLGVPEPGLRKNQPMSKTKTNCESEVN